MTIPIAMHSTFLHWSWMGICTIVIHYACRVYNLKQELNLPDPRYDSIIGDTGGLTTGWLTAN